MRSGLLDQAFADNSEPVCWDVTTVEKMEAAFVQTFSLRSVERDGNEEEADGEDMQQVRLAKEARLCDLLSALKEAGELVHELFGDNQIMSGFHYLCECHVEWVIGYIFWCASVRCTRIQGCICIGNILRFLIPLHDKSKLRVRLDDETYDPRLVLKPVKKAVCVNVKQVNIYQVFRNGEYARIRILLNDNLSPT